MIDRDDTQPERIPGLFRAWELGTVLTPGTWHIAHAGETRDGTPLVMLFRVPDGDRGDA